jgi:uncharacterized RmlC-like cupin family protein
MSNSSTAIGDATTPSIRIVRPGEQTSATAQTSGSLRLEAIGGRGGPAGMWGGTFVVEPGAKTGIHHHGAQETIVYVLEGESLVRWGDRGEHQAIARAGDFVHVPARLVHMEINPSATTPFRWVVVRVVNLPDSAWD